MGICRVELQTRGTADLFKTEEGCGNNRSVMPLDVPGCTRATMIVAVSILQVRLVNSFGYFTGATHLLRK
jgi:hypothetical protein